MAFIIAAYVGFCTAFAVGLGFAMILSAQEGED
jgi:hypothetical protein